MHCCWGPQEVHWIAQASGDAPSELTEEITSGEEYEVAMIGTFPLAGEKKMPCSRKAKEVLCGLVEKWKGVLWPSSSATISIVTV